MLKKAQTAQSTVSDRMLRAQYLETLAMAAIQQAAQDIFEGNVTRETAISRGAKGQAAGGLMQLLNKYDADSVIESVEDAIAKLKHSSDAEESDVA